MVFGIRPPTHSAVWYDARCHVLVEHVHAVGKLHDSDTFSVAHGIAVDESVLLNLADEESTRAGDGRVPFIERLASEENPCRYKVVLGFVLRTD